jgi:transcriptional regulator with XRE-family HTH domain
MGEVHRDEYQILVKRLRAERLKAGLSQTEVARHLGKSQSYVTKIEISERRMDVVQLRDFCRVLGLDFVDFIREYDADVRRTLQDQ